MTADKPEPLSELEERELREAWQQFHGLPQRLWAIRTEVLRLFATIDRERAARVDAELEHDHAARDFLKMEDERNAAIARAELAEGKLEMAAMSVRDAEGRACGDVLAAVSQRNEALARAEALQFANNEERAEWSRCAEVLGLAPYGGCYRPDAILPKLKVLVDRAEAAERKLAEAVEALERIYKSGEPMSAAIAGDVVKPMQVGLARLRGTK